LNQYYPLCLNISGKKCVVAGGGQVALRKVKTLLEHQAKVEVISPGICEEIKNLAQQGKIRTTLRPYQKGDLEGALIVIAATDERNANYLISKEAEENGILVNVVDDPVLSSFIAPACVRRGDITIAISTSGRSPALARKLRANLEMEFGEEYTTLARIVNEVRLEVKKKGIQAEGDAWQEALDLKRLIELIRQGHIEKAREVILTRLQTGSK
jgi:precorrin-2 dehydrogenase/sirohydrochlorin ferrochelatase